jgi:hypothetical protein
MYNKSLLLLVGALASIAILFSNAHGATNLNNTEFSITIPDNWAYQKSEDTLENVFGAGPWIRLIPIEFSELLINPGQELTGKSIENGGAYSSIGVDTGYPFRNVPLDIYTKYNLNLSAVKVLSKTNATIDGEDSIRIHRTPRDNSTNVEVIDYYTVHKGKPFALQLASNVKDLQNYLPQFEHIVKSFKFVELIYKCGLQKNRKNDVDDLDGKSFIKKISGTKIHIYC